MINDYWPKGALPDKTCEKCCSVYSVKFHKLPFKDDGDLFACTVCRIVLHKWGRGRQTYDYTLKKEGAVPPEEWDASFSMALQRRR